MANGESKPRHDVANDSARLETPDSPDNGSEYSQTEQQFDTGLKAWLQVLGGFFIWFNTWRGILNTFGAFQTFYEQNLLSDVSPSSIAWIGSIQSCLLLFVGVITGPLFDAGFFYTLMLLGSFLIVFGQMMTSLATEYYQLILAQGICIGIGAGCLYVPSIAVLPQYFLKRRALVTGLAATGSSIGGVIYPIMFYNLEQAIGFPWSTRSMAFLSLGTCAISVAVLRPRYPPKQERKRSLFQLSAFKELPYTLFCVGMFVCFLGFYTFLTYIQPWAADKVASQNTAFYLLPILNAASTFGRLLPGFVSDFTGPFNMLVPAIAVTAIVAFCWIAVDSVAGTVVLVAMYGFWSGGITSLPAVVVASITKDMERFGTRLGMFFAIVSVSLLVGAPIGGAILGDSQNYLGAQAYCGACLAVCATTVLVVRMLVSKGKVICKV